MKTLHIRKHFEVFNVEDGHFSIDGNAAYLYDPLRTEAPKTAVPYCCLGNCVQFLDPKTYREIEIVESHHLNSAAPMILFFAGFYWEVSGGSCIWTDQWCIKWRCVKNTRLARTLNATRTIRDEGVI